MVEIVFEDINEVPGCDPEFFVSWYSDLLNKYDCSLGDVCLIFCSDDYLLDMNRTHLDHDYYTDIITFDYREGNVVSCDLFISLDRVLDNAGLHGVTFRNELLRVCSHGVLHCVGFKDKSEEDVLKMRSAESEAIEMAMFHVERLNLSDWLQ